MQYFITFIIGTVFIFSGIIKTLNSKQFISHNLRYGFPYPKLVKLASIPFIGIESALGIALIWSEFPQWLIPSSIVLILCLSILTIWSTSSERTQDCGCYGGIVILTPQQSILLNCGYIFLLAIAWFNPVPHHHTPTWQWILALVVMVVSSVFALLSRNKPLVDFSRLKPGNSWKSHWLKDSTQDLQQGNYFVVFISPNCFYCHRWLPFLNVIHSQKNKPQILGIMSISEEEIKSFIDKEMVDFPIFSMDQLLFNYMIDGVPTGILINDGVINSRWKGVIPPELLDGIDLSQEKLTAKINN